MRILFISTFYPLHIVVGWEQLVQEINQRLQARGHINHVLANQPKGYRGHFASLNLNRSQPIIASLLSRLFAEEPAAAPYRQTAYAQAHYAHGLLYYGAGRPAQARGHLWRSLSYQPQQARERQWRSAFLKSLLPACLVQFFRPKRVKN